MTKKRFVKLLMADGYCRNDANMIANNVRERGLTYDSAYREYHVLPDMVAKIGDAMQPLIKTIRKISMAFTEASYAFTAAFRESMEKD